MTGPQFCAPRVPDVGAPEVVNRTPAALPGGSWPPSAPFIFVFSSLCPLSFPYLSSLESGGSYPDPNQEGQ